jgi:hypothetical protein
VLFVRSVIKELVAIFLRDKLTSVEVNVKEKNTLFSLLITFPLIIKNFFLIKMRILKNPIHTSFQGNK